MDSHRLPLRQSIAVEVLPIELSCLVSEHPSLGLSTAKDIPVLPYSVLRSGVCMYIMYVHIYIGSPAKCQPLPCMCQVLYRYKRPHPASPCIDTAHTSFSAVLPALNKQSLGLHRRAMLQQTREPRKKKSNLATSRQESCHCAGRRDGALEIASSSV